MVDDNDDGRYFVVGTMFLVALAIVGIFSIVGTLREIIDFSERPVRLCCAVETRDVGVQTDADVASSSSAPMADEGPYRARTVEWMRGELRRRGMQVSGVRCDVVRRLRLDDASRR